MKFFRNDHLYTINNKQTIDAQAKSQMVKDQFISSLCFDQKGFQNKPENKLSTRTKFGFSLGHAFNDMASSVWFCYSLLYFKLYFSNSIAGSLVLVGQVADAILTPFIGYYCDKQKCTPDSFFILRAGRRKSWHILGTVILIFTFPLTYTYPLLIDDNGQAFKSFTIHTILYVILIAAFQGCWAGVQVSHVSLITDLTKVQNERVALNAYRQATTVASNLFIYVLMLFLLRNSTEGDSVFSKKDAKVVAVVSFLACILGIILTLIFYVLVKEPGQCFFNKRQKQIKKQSNLANSFLNSPNEMLQNTHQLSRSISKITIDKNILSNALPEFMNNRLVGSTESSDYMPGKYIQTSVNDITPYLYPSFYFQIKPFKQNNEIEPVAQPNIFTVSKTFERPKLFSSISCDTYVSHAESLNNGASNLYKKKPAELEKKKSRLSLKSVTVPVRRMFSVDTRRQFDCKDWLKCSTFWKVAIIYMMSRLYFNLTQAYTTLYLTYTLKLNKSSIAIIPFVVYLSGFVISLSARPISATLGSRYVLLIGCIFSIISCVWFNFGDEANLNFKEWQVYGACAFNGVGCTAILISSMALTADLIGDNTKSAFVFGAMGFFDKLINGLAVYLLELFNPETPNYYQYVLVYVAGTSVLFTLIGLFSIRGSSLGKLKTDNMLKELVEKSSQQIH